MSNFDHTQNQFPLLNDNDEHALSTYENECERVIHESLTNGQDLYTQKLFIAFQNAATNLTKMFRGKKRKTMKENHLII